MKWSQYQNWLKDQVSGKWVEPGSAAPSPNQINTDSRHIEDGDFFVPIVGENFDGHRFINDALAKGAKAFLYQPSKIDLIDASILKFGIPVQDTLKSLQLIATGWLDFISPKQVIAVTGSVGKTTVKEMLRNIFELVGKSHTTQSSFNNEIGVPLTILSAPKDTEYLILEYGARHSGDIAFLCKIGCPSIAVLLNTKHVHIGEFGSFEKLIETKTEMFRDSRVDATLIAPADDPNLVSIASKTGKSVISFGKSASANVAISDVKWGDQSDMNIEIKIADNSFPVHLTAAHESYPLNVAAAAAISYAAGLENSVIADGLKNFKPAPGRFQIFREGNLTIVNDAYNASPESMLAAFKSLAQLYPDKKIGLVLGDMKELGSTSEDEHLRVGKESVTIVHPIKLIGIGEFKERLAKGAESSGMNPKDIQQFNTVGDLLASGYSHLVECEVIFLKASNSLKFSDLVSSLKTWERSK